MRVFLRSLLLCFFYISLSAFSRVDLGEREPLTHQFFDVLIQQSHEMDNSFLVLKVVSTQVIFYAPENFLNYVKDNFSEFSDPLTRQPISDMGIYRIPVGTEEVQFSREETDRFFEILLATIQEKRDNQILPKDIEIIRYIVRTGEQFPMARARACILSAQIYRDGRGGVARNRCAAKIYAERARCYCIQAGLEYPETVDFWVLIMAEQLARELSESLVDSGVSQKLIGKSQQGSYREFERLVR